jgi:DNA-binding response OmpR family regulator
VGATRVLIVEDQAAARDALRRMARREGFDVLTAATPQEAIASLDPVPDCVILDLVLAGGDGETVLAKIRSERIPVRVVAVVTGLNDALRLQKVNELRPELLLYKPIDSEVLFRVCKSLL